MAISGEGIKKLKEAILRAKPPAKTLNLDTQGLNEGTFLLKKRIKLVEGLLKGVLKKRGALNKNLS